MIEKALSRTRKEKSTRKKIETSDVSGGNSKDKDQGPTIHQI